jgi:hypothetical protein
MSDRPRAARKSQRGAPQFATFWHGPLNAMAFNCVAVFAHSDASLRVYCYDRNIEAPDGVEVADAREICPDPSLINRYIVAGRPSLAAFADQFRYRMIRDTGCCWIDTDIVCLRKPDFTVEPIVFGRQAEARGKALINNAVLKLPPGQPVLTRLIEIADQSVDKDISWGAIGPFLLTDLAEAAGIGDLALGADAFYPIAPDDFWKPFLPAYRDEVANATRASTFLHLWSALIDRAGYDSSIGPPAGSFLHGAFSRAGALDRFTRIYDDDEIERIMAPWMPDATTAGRGRA